MANIIILISITDLGKHQSASFIQKMGANMLIVSPYVDFTSGVFSNITPAQASQFLPAEAVAGLQGAPGIDGVVGVALLPGHVGFKAARWFTTLEGVSQPYQEMRGDKISAGRWFTPAEAQQKARVACLGDTVRQELFGDGNGLGESVVIKGERFEVLATLEPAGRLGLEDIDNRVFMPLGTALELFNYDGIQGLFLRYQPRHGGIKGHRAHARTAQAAGQARRGHRRDGLDLDAERRDQDDERHAGGVSDRTHRHRQHRDAGGRDRDHERDADAGDDPQAGDRHPALRRRTGCRGADRSSWPRASCRRSLGLALGIGLGFAGVAAYCAFAGWDPYVSPATVVLAVTFGTGTGMLFGAYPAYRAAQLDPVQCLRG